LLLPFWELWMRRTVPQRFGFQCRLFSSLAREEAGLFGDSQGHGCQVPTMVLLGTRLARSFFELCEGDWGRLRNSACPRHPKSLTNH